MVLIVGIPSLRLKGDYLAIVHLDSPNYSHRNSEHNTVGGATGYPVPGYAIFLDWNFHDYHHRRIHNIIKSDTGRALVSIRETTRGRSDGRNTTRYKLLLSSWLGFRRNRGRSFRALQ